MTPSSARWSLKFIARLGVKCCSPDQPIRELSGGNQQKVLLARWLAMNSKLLILDEPTRGIDVGAKAEIQRTHQAARRRRARRPDDLLRTRGNLEGSDRVFVLREGRSVAELPHGEASESGGDGGDGAWRERISAEQERVVMARRRSRTRRVARRRDWRPVAHALCDARRVDRADPLQSGRSPAISLSWQTLDVNLTQVASIVIVGVGMTLVIATGGIDLSVGSLMAIAGAIAPIIFLDKVVQSSAKFTSPSPSSMIVAILRRAAHSAGSTAG